MEIADSRVGAGGQKGELTGSLLTSGIGRYQMNLELPRLRWGGEEKVKMAPPCEDSPGMGFFVCYYHRSRSQVMANTSDKVKEGIHDAAEKVKDVAHNVGEKVKHAAHNVAEKTKDVAHNVGEKVKHAAHNVAEKTKDVAHNVGKKVKHAAHNVAEKTKDVLYNVGEKIKDAGR